MNDLHLKHILPTRSIRLGLLASVVVGCGLIISSFIQAAVNRPDQLPGAIGQPLAEAAATFPNCRFGAGGAISSGYAITLLNLGWYMDWSAQSAPAHPGGAEFVQVVRLKPTEDGYTFTPALPALYQIADQNPGAVWLIGNEPDSPFQDQLLPEAYALAYHDLYGWLKQRDPTARIGAGSIVQPTPLRLKYLDRSLSAYRQLYDQAMPVDVWSIHSYILREIDVSDPQACLSNTNCTEPPYEIWGAFIPPGLLGPVTRGMLYTYSNMFDISLFHQRLIDFRTWLRDRGYRDVPLYITEFGTLFPYPPFTADPYYDEFGQEITEARSITFMNQTFNLLRTASDASVGYPADDNRLVQRWLWYSFGDVQTFGGALFNPGTGQRTLLGNAWVNYVQAITPTRDLLAVRVVAEPAAVQGHGQPQTTTLKATLSNLGNISVTQPMTVAFYAGVPPTGALIGLRPVSGAALAGCGAATVVTLTWPNLDAGLHPMYIQVDPAATLSETSRANNQAVGQFLVSTYQTYLPVSRKE